MDKHIKKEHNVSLLLYHFVFPAKYRREVFIDGVEESLVSICERIGDVYECRFEEIGADKNHVHFLIQGLPTQAPSALARKIKSITARELFAKHPEIKKKLWGGELWAKGYYVNTVGMYGDYEMIKSYVKNQGVEQEYKIRYKNTMGMTSLFEGMAF